MNTEQNTEEISTNECITSNEVVSKVTIGEFLRSAREEKNLSIKVISQHTKISVTILENIENNTFNNLPSKAYVIGFVKSYSKTIGLDEAQCLQLLNEAYGTNSETLPKLTPTPLEETQKTNPPVESTPSREIPSQYLTITGVFVALIILFAIVINNTSNQPNEDIASDDEEITQELAQTPLVDVKPQEVSETTPLTTVNVAPEEETSIKVAQPVEKKIVEVKPVVKKELKEEIKKEEKVEEKKTLNTEKKNEEVKKVTLRAIPLPLFEILNNEEAYTYLPENIKSSLIQGKQNVFISAVDGDTWITYKSDNNAIKKFVLHQGRTLLIRGDVLRIFLGNVNVARIFLNNKALKITSRSGVKSLVFPVEDAQSYKLPLFIYPKPGKVITSSEYEKNLLN